MKKYLRSMEGHKKRIFLYDSAAVLVLHSFDIFDRMLIPLLKGTLRNFQVAFTSIWINFLRECSKYVDIWFSLQQMMCPAYLETKFTEMLSPLLNNGVILRDFTNLCSYFNMKFKCSVNCLRSLRFMEQWMQNTIVTDF